LNLQKLLVTFENLDSLHLQNTVHKELSFLTFPEEINEDIAENYDANEETSCRRKGIVNKQGAFPRKIPLPIL